MRKLILSAFICLSTIYAFGQQAVWNSSTNTNYVWNYIFDADKSSQEKGAIFPVPPLNNEVLAGYYQIWVNNVRLKANANDFNFPADGLPKGKNLNSLLLTGSNSKTADVPSNDGSVLFSKLSINFTNP
nr:hypothetical protein [uncultured Pedobacter sp.]